eukprot:4552265-Pyramimonas_sp.AAC.1
MKPEGRPAGPFLSTSCPLSAGGKGPPEGVSLEPREAAAGRTKVVGPSAHSRLGKCDAAKWHLRDAPRHP